MTTYARHWEETEMHIRREREELFLVEGDSE